MNTRFPVTMLIVLVCLGLMKCAWAQNTELHGTPLSEAYRKQFERCDASDRFGDVQFPITRAGKTIWYGCKSDPSWLTRLEKIDAKGSRPEAILFEAKLARDDDGSPKACSNPGTTDQCGTALMLKPTAAQPCPFAVTKGKVTGQYCLPINAAEIPYLVIPGFGPKGIDSREFRQKTGISMGDLAVVIAQGKVIPAIVADVGPAYKIGEGSAALLVKLSSNGQPDTIGHGVRYIVFPGTSLGHDTSADTLRENVQVKAMALYNSLIRTLPTGD
jgi:hypothetical protein